jgi:hypothetical protein
MNFKIFVLDFFKKFDINPDPKPALDPECPEKSDQIPHCSCGSMVIGNNQVNLPN